MRAQLQGENHASWIDCIDDLIVAHIAVHQVDLIPRPVKVQDGFGVITENYALPEYRDQGIGSRLLHHVIEWARAADHELLIVYPGRRARPFYARAGFGSDSGLMELALRDYVPISPAGEP